VQENVCQPLAMPCAASCLFPGVASVHVVVASPGMFDDHREMTSADHGCFGCRGVVEGEGAEHGATGWSLQEVSSGFDATGFDQTTADGAEDGTVRANHHLCAIATGGGTAVVGDGRHGDALAC